MALPDGLRCGHRRRGLGQGFARRASDKTRRVRKRRKAGEELSWWMSEESE